MRPATDVVIRPETPADRAAVRDVVLRAFGPGEDVVADLVDALRDLPGEAMSYLAEVDGDPVGHVMLSTSLLDAPRRLVDVLVLSPLGVVPEFQRRGVGAGLIDTAMAAARAHGAPLLFLEGDPAYYSRRGFVTGEPQGFRKPSLRIPDAAFQVVKLPAYETWMTGTLVYAWPFWALDCVGLRDPNA